MFAEAVLACRGTDPTMIGVIGAEEIFELSAFGDAIKGMGARIVPLS